MIGTKLYIALVSVIFADVSLKSLTFFLVLIHPAPAFPFVVFDPSPLRDIITIRYASHASPSDRTYSCTVPYLQQLTELHIWTAWTQPATAAGGICHNIR
jgi:hypothetical protein